MSNRDGPAGRSSLIDFFLSQIYFLFPCPDLSLISFSRFISYSISQIHLFFPCLLFPFPDLFPNKHQQPSPHPALRHPLTSIWLPTWETFPSNSFPCFFNKISIFLQKSLQLACQSFLSSFEIFSICLSTRGKLSFNSFPNLFGDLNLVANLGKLFL